jgi:hypothetical protein
VVYCNALHNDFLKDSDWREYADVIKIEIPGVEDCLKKLKDAAPRSPNKTTLEKIYTVETRVLAENKELLKRK